MAKIAPVTFPIVGDATTMNVMVLNFPTRAKNCTLYFELVTDANIKCVDGNYQLTEEEFDGWGYDNTYLDMLVANRLGITIVEEVVVDAVVEEQPVENMGEGQ